MNLADTHSAETAKRYYHKRNIKQNASKAVALTRSLYDRLNNTTAAASPNTTYNLSPVAPAAPAVQTAAAAASNATAFVSTTVASQSSSSSSAAAAAVATASVAAASVPVIDPSQLLKLFTTTRRMRSETRMTDGSGMYYVTRAIGCLLALISLYLNVI